MSFLRNKKKASYKIIENNLLTAPRIAHAIAQIPANTKDGSIRAVDSFTYEDIKCVENATLVGIRSGVMTNYDAEVHAVPMVVFNEELHTDGSIALSAFAEHADVDGKIYVRALPLYVGDVFTTDNFSGERSGAKYAKIVDGILELETTMSADTLFSIVESTLPAGQLAVEATYEGKINGGNE